MKLIFETEYAETQHTKTVFVSFHSLSIGCKSFFFLHVEMVEKIGMFAFKSVCLYFRFSISFRISDLVAVFLLLLFTLNASLMCAVFFSCCLLFRAHVHKWLLITFYWFTVECLQKGQQQKNEPLLFTAHTNTHSPFSMDYEHVCVCLCAIFVHVVGGF